MTALRGEARCFLLALLLLVAVAVFTVDSDEAHGHHHAVTRLSITPHGTPAEWGGSAPDISANGSVVAFDSVSGDLDEGDRNEVADVFVHDLGQGGAERVSVSSLGVEGDGPSRHPRVSADGRFVAFQSEATTLVANDENVWCLDHARRPANCQDVFVHDRQTGETQRVSVSSSGEEARGQSGLPAISGDGRYVAFYSTAPNLVRDDTNGTADVFVRDRLAGVTSRASVGFDGDELDGISTAPAISDEGRYVAFESDASNVVTEGANLSCDRNFDGVPDPCREIYLSDLSTGAVERVSVASDRSYTRGHSSFADVSAGAEVVTFVSTANLTGDGRHSHVYARDRRTGQTILVTRGWDGRPGNGASSMAWWPRVSSDGRYVGFGSEASNLVPGDTNGHGDAFVSDLAQGRIAVVSTSASGELGNDYSGSPVVADGGRLVAFASWSTNLTATRGPLWTHVYLKDRGESTCPDDVREEGGLSTALHHAEPLAGPAGSVVHDISCTAADRRF